MARRAAWQDYAAKRRSQREGLGRRSATDAKARKEFMKYARSIRSAVNYRLKSLRRAKFDYGAAYNNISHYLDTQFDSGLFPPIASFGGDYEELQTSLEYGLKFLKTSGSTVTSMRSMEKYRVARLQELDVLPKTKVMDGRVQSLDYRDYEDFLRYLGTEEIYTGKEQYGTSSVIVDFVWDYWQQHDGDTRAMGLLTESFRQWLDVSDKTIESFNQLVELRGFHLEDYLSKYTRTHPIQGQ